MCPQTSPQADNVWIPRRGPRLTLLALGWGALILIWLSVEDSGVGAVSGLGAGLALVISTLATVNKWGGRAYPRSWLLPSLAIGGGLTGILSSGTTALLMVIKNAAHSHMTVDYPLTIVTATLARTPAWGAAGMLMGVGAALLWGLCSESK